MTGPPVIDSHIHFWDRARHDHEWLDDEPLLQRRYTPDDLPPAARAVDAMVFVQADCRADQGWAEVRWIAELAESFEAIQGIVAFAPLERGARARAELERLSEEPLVVGVRRLLQAESPEFFGQPELIDGLDLLSEFSLPFDLCVTHEQLRATRALVERVPQVSFVLDHAGKPPVRDGAIAEWLSDLRALAALPNVACKLSGLATEAMPAERPEVASVPYLRAALDAFGPRRCMFGSDWPVASTAVAYERWLEIVNEVLDDAGEDGRAAVLAANAAAVYALEPVRQEA